MDRLLDGELQGFERWFLERQRAAGRTPTPLISAEKGIVKTYIHYLASK